MKYISFIMCLSVFLVSYIKEKNLYNPACLVSLIWSIVTYFAMLDLYGFYETSELAYFLIGIGILSFYVGANGLRKISFSFHKKNKSVKDYEINTIILHTLCIISVVLLIYPSYKGMQNLVASGFNFIEVRNNMGIGYPNIILQLIYNYIVIPFSFAIVPIFATVNFVIGKNDKILNASTIFVIAARVITEGGRIIVLYLIVSILLSYMIRIKTSNKKVGSRKKIRIILIVLLSVCVVLKVTVSRTDSSLFEHLYGYLTGPAVHLSVRLEEIKNCGFYSMGAASYYGILEFVCTMLENIGFSYPTFMVQVGQYIKSILETVTVGVNGMTFNAFTGPFYHMYLDGRIFGVIFGMMFYGFYTYKVYNRIKTKLNYRSVAIYLLLAQGLVFSFVRMQFSVMNYAVAFIFFYIVFCDKKNIIKIKCK